MAHAPAQRIPRLSLSAHDLEGSAAFYVDALGFTRAEAAEGRVRLRVGAQEIELAPAEAHAPAYPQPCAANDPWFQHFAIAVADMDAAYDRLTRHGGSTPISRGGPQRLPPSTGSVTAYKFRDPEGHPLELSYIPGSDWLSAPREAGAVFLGIDHTAIASADLAASLAFYSALGFTAGQRFLNTGPEQDRLDGLDGVVLDIATLMAPGGGPHIELLHYRSPAPAPAQARIAGVAATVIDLAASAPALSGEANVFDPDGHRVRLRP